MSLLPSKVETGHEYNLLTHIRTVSVSNKYLRKYLYFLELPKPAASIWLASASVYQPMATESSILGT